MTLWFQSKDRGSDQRLEFRARVRKGGGAGTTCFIEFPADSALQLGSRARVPVIGTVNGFPVRTSAMPTGCGNHEMMFNKEMRKGAGAGPGDSVEVLLSRDRATRTVALPSDLARALATSPRAQARWAKMSYSHQKEYVDWIAGAKKPETRENRVSRAVSKVKAGKPFR